MLLGTDRVWGPVLAGEQWVLGGLGRATTTTGRRLSDHAQTKTGLFGIVDLFVFVVEIVMGGGGDGEENITWSAE